MAGAIHYRFRSAKTFSSLPIEDHYIKLQDFKKEIMDSCFPGFISERGNVKVKKNLFLVISNAQTGYQYSEDEGETLIVKNTSLIIHRQPAYSVRPLTDTVVHETENPKLKVKEISDSYLPDLDDFGEDPFAPPQPQSTIKAISEEKITPLDGPNMLVEQEKGISCLEHSNSRPLQPQGFVTQMMMPPKGYVCHRCHTPGHFIQHCPTNGDPNFDKKRPLTIYPQHPQVSVSTSSYSWSSSSSGDLPAGLYCPLCKQVMKDAVMRKCCFDSFCEGCIRNHIVSKSMCFCMAKDVSVDHFVPNMTIRQTIARLLDSSSSGSSNSSTSTSNISQAKESPAPMVHQPVAPPTTTNFAGLFRQNILQKVAQAAVVKQDKEQKLHPRSYSEGLQNAKRPKIEFLGQYPMPSAHPSYQGNWNYGSQGHSLPLVSPQLGF
ncbi:RING-type E3 ubiquitin transferase [Ranunculus cassubicifolius]